MIDEKAIRQRYEVLAPALDELPKRRFAPPRLMKLWGVEE